MAPQVSRMYTPRARGLAQRDAAVGLVPVPHGNAVLRLRTGPATMRPLLQDGHDSGNGPTDCRVRRDAYRRRLQVERAVLLDPDFARIDPRP
jgi:hypothetical protein